MRVIRQEKSFLKDLKAIKKRRYPLNELIDVVELLSLNGDLFGRYKDHALTGNWQGCRECHIRQNWLLIYRVTDTELILIATGTHDDLF